MKRFFPIIFLLALLLTACSTQRQIEPKHYQTMSQRAQATLQIDNQQYSMTCVIQMWRNELVVLSLQPIVGMEMVRIEAEADSILVVDKMNQRYTTLAYDWAEELMYPTPSLKMIQDFVTAPIEQKKDVDNQISININQHKMTINCKYTQREYNTLGDKRRINLKKYKRVTLRDILPI